MNRWTLRCALALLALSLASHQSHGCWIDVPLEVLVARSPLIVVGTIERVGHVPPVDDAVTDVAPDTAYLEIERVLKHEGDLPPVRPGSVVALGMPSIRRSFSMSTDIFHTTGQSGVWILERSNLPSAQASVLYWADYPADHQPLANLRTIQRLIGKQRKR
jgi:hypothetical protein